METLAYDLVLEAAMRAQHFSSRNLRIDGLWKWLLTEFADYYGVSDSYTRIRYYRHYGYVECSELKNINDSYSCKSICCVLTCFSSSL